MKKYIYTIILFAVSSALWAQGPGKDRKRGMLNDQIESNRIAFFTQFLGLSTTQAQGFWPIYNEMRDSEQALRKDFILPKEVDAMTDAEAASFLDQWKNQEQAILDNRAKYIEQIRGVLTDRQVVKMLSAERMFKERLLRRLRQP